MAAHGKFYNYHLRLLSFIIMAYMLLVFGWWSILLYTQNSTVFKIELDKLRLIQASEERYISEQVFKESEEYQHIYDNYMRQQWMIFGEALFFIVSILVAIWIMNRGYNDLVNSARQQRNFLLSITHELKSPMASIQLGLETILKRNLSADKTREIARYALTENERLNSLVNNLLIAAKFESSYEQVYEETEIIHFFKEIIQTLEPRMQYATINLISPNQLFAEVDQTSLEFVIKNLVENAYKYSTEDEKLIDIHVNEIDDENWQFSVSDNGIGIPQEERDKIFEKFYRIGSEDTRQTKGTGIGLYIIDTVVNGHKGYIEVYDNKPKGTVFEINLPKYQS